MAGGSSEARCRKCGELMLWVMLVSNASPRGKPHPLDAVPVLGGTIERKRGVVSTEWYGRVVPKAERVGPLYVSHFATCPHANHFRGTR